MSFLPVTKAEAADRGWETPDFVIVTGDAYVDHPSFGTAVVARVLEAEGYSVCIIPQPDWRDTRDFTRFGRPRLAFLVNSGNVDSMVAHYTAAKKPRSSDYYSPGGKAGMRPDRAVIVYCNRIREAYGDVPVIIGGVEASTRRFAHYDYWTDSVRRSILIDSRADLISYGMGESSLRRIAFLLDKGVPVKKICDVRGTCFTTDDLANVHFDAEDIGDYDILKTDKAAFARAFKLQHDNQDSVYGKALVEKYGARYCVQNPPMPPLTRNQLDFVYSLPYMRAWHPCYDAAGGVPAIEEVKFSITHCRGCFGGCNFCSITFLQGRTVTSRSIASVVEEAKIIAAMPDFKGYIHDVGGPTANFRHASCEKQKTQGVCKNRQCLFPAPCPNINADHSEYLELLEQVEAVPGVKKVFVRSGIRYDYILCGKNDKFLRHLVSHNVSGQLKVAPEHICDGVLYRMGKPGAGMYEKFVKKFFEYSRACGKEQYIVPYLMSSHPGSTLDDAIELALYLKKNKLNPEQVQDFYPTPGTASTCMYHTGIDPFTGKNVYVARDYASKQAQRALLQFYKKENHALIRRVLAEHGRADLIGFGEDKLVPPEVRSKPPKTAQKGAGAQKKHKNNGIKHR